MTVEGFLLNYSKFSIPGVPPLAAGKLGAFRILSGQGKYVFEFDLGLVSLGDVRGWRSLDRGSVAFTQQNFFPGVFLSPLGIGPFFRPLLLLLLLLLLEPHRARIHSPQWLMTSTPRVSCQKPGGKAWPLPSSQFPRTCQCLPLLQCNRRATGKGIWGNSFRSCSPQSGEEYGEGQG